MLEHNALLADSPFDTAAQTSSLAPTFRLGGTATLSDASVRVRSDGLYVDVGPHRLGTWRGFFVATGATYPADSVGGAWGPYQARFQDLWIAAGSSLQIDGLHSGDRVTLTPAATLPSARSRMLTGRLARSCR